MSIGDNIHRIRTEKGISLKQLADMVGVDKSYICAYEAGRRTPKIQSLDAIARALDVHIEVLNDTPFDGVNAMHTLFKLFDMYNGKLTQELDENGVSHIKMELEDLRLMDSWYERYARYQQDLKIADEISNSDAKLAYIDKISQEYNIWLRDYPNSDKNPGNLGVQLGLDRIGNRTGKLPR